VAIDLSAIADEPSAMAGELSAVAHEQPGALNGQGAIAPLPFLALGRYYFCYANPFIKVYCYHKPLISI
jgi:hypothetical protein